MTAEEYFRAIDADVFAHNRRIELWEGYIHEKMAKKLPHTVSQGKIMLALTQHLPEGWTLWPEGPILIDDFTAPLPDLAIVRGRLDDYYRRGSNPKSGEIGLVIEVAETSRRKNPSESLKVYARAELPHYWLVNLVAARVEVYSQPRIEGAVASYAMVHMFESGNDVPLVLENQEVARIPVRDILPEQGNG
jgi:Uma2 family endonuclease